jgi:(1->4)-alpha-D-glucan 1-alpha-D-glucosylmutase
VAGEEINYRRFFAINTLAAIRQVEPDVFQATHRLLMKLLADGSIDGVRIDHPDGLWDPEAYFFDLQAEYITVRTLVNRGVPASAIDDEEHSDHRAELRAKARREVEADAGARLNWPLYVLGEKILEHGEALPPRWAIAGTVGYDFAHATTALFVQTGSRQMFDRIFSRFTGDSIRFPELVYTLKLQMMAEAFQSEIVVLTNALNRIAEADRRFRDFTINSLRTALQEVMASFPVYRTYTTCADEQIDDRDRRYIEEAVALAKRRNPGLDPSLFGFVQDVLLLHVSEEPGAVARFDRRCYFAMKFQQLSGPVMAKGLEDTAFYRHNRLVSLNEVGGDPSRFGINPEEFHRQNRQRLRRWPAAMLTSSTHDTKRGEDVRARISALSDRPTEWRAALNRWTRLNRKFKQLQDGALAPHRADEYVIYQTLVGTWPLDGIRDDDRPAYVERLHEYMIKVVREAARFSNWVNPDEAYEDSLRAFIAGIFNVRRSGRFLADIEKFVEDVVPLGLSNALAAQVLKLTSPGVPDIYQGTEIWDDSLVDPDNRRAVDFGRIASLADTHDSIDDAWGARNDGAVKLMVTRALLGLRGDLPAVFSHGDYIALDTGDVPQIAFLRQHDEALLLVAVAVTSESLDVSEVVIPEPYRDVEWTDVLRPGQQRVKQEQGHESNGAAPFPVCVWHGILNQEHTS